MYLLNTNTFQLHFFAYDAPPYAVVSHTWGLEEVTPEDIRDLQIARAKQGFSKVVAACRLAHDAGLQFLWFDACCVNASSPAEVSEAVNSMFRWFQHAQVCFVHLADFMEDEVAGNSD